MGFFKKLSSANNITALTLLVGWQEGHPACKKTECWHSIHTYRYVCCDVGLLVVMIWLELCTTYSSRLLLPPLSSLLALIKSRMDTFWYRLTQVHMENGR